jgi:hypothetical protein
VYPAVLASDGRNGDSDQEDAYWSTEHKELGNFVDEDAGFGLDGGNMGYDVGLVGE